MNLTSAKRAAEFAQIQKTDKRGRATKVLVPGHNGAWYEVLVRRYAKNGIQVVSTQCACVKDALPCKGNSNSICYHSLAAIMAGAKKTGVKISFCKTKEDAENLSHIGGDSHIIESVQSEKITWMIAKDSLKSTIAF